MYFKELLSFKNTNGFLRIPSEKTIFLHCPSGFQYIPENFEVMATCQGENHFQIGRHIYEFSQLSCREEVPLTVRKTGRRCRNEESELMKIGYTARTKFFESIAVCLDKERNAPIYAKHRLRKSMANVEPKDMTMRYNDDSLPLNLDEIYNCDIQINHISANLGKWFHPEDKCCFKKRQLVNARDLPTGLAQKAAFSYLNVVPQWSTCSSKVRKLVITTFEIKP